MITVPQIENIISQVINNDMFLVEARVHPGNRIMVFVDKKRGEISLQDCSDISRKIDEALNRDQEDFELEVSSPGLGSPFKVNEQYVKNIGQEVDVLLKSGIREKGRLIVADENRITLETAVKTKNDKGKKEWITVQKNLLLTDIKETKIIVTIK